MRGKTLLVTLAIFLACFWLPVGSPRFDQAVLEGLHLVRWYAREHVVLCLIPAFFIAGAIATFVRQGAVLRYLGPQANRLVAYGVASVSGTVLAVCSCTVLPLFAGIYRRGAGIGPASAFLYAGPAINILAIILTARVLGLELGIARGVGAVVFAVVIGLAMQATFREGTADSSPAMSEDRDTPARSLLQDSAYFAVLAGILVFANWAPPAEPGGVWGAIHGVRWMVTGAFAIALGAMLCRWFQVRGGKLLLVGAAVLVASFAAGKGAFPPVAPFLVGVAGLSVALATSSGEAADWLESSWGFAKLILPLLLVGVLVAGALLGRPGHEGLIPGAWVSAAVGGNSLRANLVASVAGAFMYFATLTEVPILQGLIASGMGKGPALALLLAGPALSLPSMLVIRSILGTRKALVYVILVVVMSTVTGVVYGWWFAE